MPVELFEGSKRKIAQGRRHSAALESEVAKFLARDPWAVLLELNRSTGEHQVALRGREELPAEIALIFGDAIHNFRSALDLLANDLVALAGGKSGDASFPFAESAAKLEEQIKSKMKGVTSEVVQVVRELQPYHHGNTFLRAMHDLDIADKHKAILNVSRTGTTSPVPFEQVGYERIPGDKPNRITLKANFGALKAIPIDLTGFKPSKPDIEIIGKVAGSVVNITIAKGFPLEGKAVTEVANEMALLAESIIAEFEKQYLRK